MLELKKNLDGLPDVIPTEARRCPNVIPAKAGIHTRRAEDGFRVKPGMTIIGRRLTLWETHARAGFLDFFPARRDSARNDRSRQALFPGCFSC